MPLKLSNQTTFRENVIMYFYQKELFDKTIDQFDSSFDFNAQEINAIDWINKKYEFLKADIVKFLAKDWPWSRLMPLERAILLVAAFELHIRDKKIVINEAVNYSKKFIVEIEKSNFINGILDNIGKYYEAKKQKH